MDTIAKYQVAGILIEFKPFFEDYLETFEPFRYEGDAPAAYTIRTFIEETLSPPEQPPDYRLKDRLIFRGREGETTLKQDREGNVPIKVYQSYDRRTSYLYLKAGLASTNAEREYIFTGMLFMKIALNEGLLGLHGAAVAYNGEAVIFAAPSRTGKSTHRRLWQRHYEIETINDDKPLLSLEQGEIWVHPSPWSGKSRLTGTTPYPLHTIVFLSRGEENCIRELDFKESLEHLMRNCYRPDSEDLWDRLFEILEHLKRHTPMLHYACKKENQAAITLHNYLFGGKHED